MQPIQINVSVNIGLDSELFTLLSSIVNRPAQETELPATKQMKPARPQPKPEVENQPSAVQEPEQPDKPKEYAEADVRAAMDRTRARIEGDNWSENTGSDGYKKWHKALNAWFKNTSALFGAEKPSLLPDSESRAKFIACCDAVYVENGELVEKTAF